MTVVDIHCHVFNAEDLPVRGFLHRVHLHSAPLGAAAAGLLDRVVQGFAPGFAPDMARLDALLGGDVGLEAAAPRVPQDFEADVERTFTLLQATEPDLLADAGAALVAEEPGTLAAASILDVLDASKRLLRWVMLFGRSRLDLVANLVRDFDNQLDLAIPLLVDLGTGLGDTARTTGRQQVELFEKLSRATMRGVLPDVGNLRLHPFVGFDPLGELRARRADAIEKPLDLVRVAVTDYGFVGVKVYPPMGWRPTGNRERPGLSRADADELDLIVHDLAAWCAANDVPITAHSADSNHADPTYRAFGSPEEWSALLDAHPGLRVNLGHFGGVPAGGRPTRIAAAMAARPGLYADIGNHGVGDEARLGAYFDMLTALMSTSDLGDRLMYGSDWYMVAAQQGYQAFLETYRSRYTEAFGADRAAGFLGGNALSFLGFDDPANLNNRRLTARYERFAPENTPDWLKH